MSWGSGLTWMIFVVTSHQTAQVLVLLVVADPYTTPGAPKVQTAWPVVDQKEAEDYLAVEFPDLSIHRWETPTSFYATFPSSMHLAQFADYVGNSCHITTQLHRKHVSPARKLSRRLYRERKHLHQQSFQELALSAVFDLANEIIHELVESCFLYSNDMSPALATSLSTQDAATLPSDLQWHQCIQNPVMEEALPASNLGDPHDEMHAAAALMAAEIINGLVDACFPLLPALLPQDDPKPVMEEALNALNIGDQNDERQATAALLADEIPHGRVDACFPVLPALSLQDVPTRIFQEHLWMGSPFGTPSLHSNPYRVSNMAVIQVSTILSITTV